MARGQPVDGSPCPKCGHPLQAVTRHKRRHLFLVCDYCGHGHPPETQAYIKAKRERGE